MTATQTNMELASIVDVNRLAEQIKDYGTLCEFFAGHRRACEAETMVAQTIHGARFNAEKHGKPFSFKGDGVTSTSGAGLVDNATAYGWLVTEEFFVEEKCEDHVVIFPTKKLIDRLDKFFSRKAPR